MSKRSSKESFNGAKNDATKSKTEGFKNLDRLVHPDLHKKIETYKKLIKSKEERQKLDTVFKDHHKKAIDVDVKGFVRRKYFEQGVRVGLHTSEQQKHVNEVGRLEKIKLEHQSLKRAKAVLDKNTSLTKYFKNKSQTKNKSKSMDKDK